MSVCLNVRMSKIMHTASKLGVRQLSNPEGDLKIWQYHGLSH